MQMQRRSDQHSPTSVPQATAPDRNRRAFLHALATPALISAAGMSHAQTTMPASSALASLADDAAFWSGIRDLFPLRQSLRFMNVGTAGSMPIESLRVLTAESERIATDALDGYGDHRAHREAVASSFGAQADEIVIASNASDAICHALLGLTWRAGDEILTTNHEHRSGNSPLALLTVRAGVRVKRVSLPVGPRQRAEDHVEIFARAIGPKTRAIFFSAPTYKTGTMLPITQLARLAQERKIISICDAAHLPGMMAFRASELGLDFLAGSGHKWQCGPGGTGLLYVRNRVLPAFNPRPLPPFYPLMSSNFPATGLPPRARNEVPTEDIAARIQNLGSRNTALYDAFVKSCEIWDRIGRDKIEAYILGMARHLRQLIANEWGEAALYSSLIDPRLDSAMVTFNPFRNSGDVTDRARSNEFVRLMRDDHGFVVRNTSFEVIGQKAEHHPIRISTHLWLNFDDVRNVVEAMSALSRRMSR